MNIRKNLATFLMIGILVVVVFYILQNMSTETAQDPKPRVTLAPEDQVDEKGPKVGVNLTLSPVFINLVLNREQTGQANFFVTNNNAFAEDYKLSILKFKPDSTGSKPVPLEVSAQDEFVKGIQFSENEFNVKPNQKKVITLKFTPPKNSEIGYYFAIMVSRKNERQIGKKETLIAGAPTLPVLVEVKSPTAKKAAEMVEFKTSSPWYEYLPTEFHTTIKNTGNIHLIPFGDIFIDQGGKKDIASVLINPTNGNVLPGTKRTFYSQWNDGFIVRVPKKNGDTYALDKKGNTIYETTIDWSKISKFRFGKYTAVAILVYHDGERDIPIEATTSFWIIPWKILLGTIVVVFLLVQGIRSSLLGVGSTLRGNK